MANKLWNYRETSNLWGSSVVDTNGEINLRDEMHELLFGSISKPQRGHWIIYRRFDTTKKTENYDEVYRTGVDGHAYEYTDTLIMSRRDPSFSPESHEASTPMGILQGGKDAYFFEFDVEPRPEDQILEFTWDNHTVKPKLNIITDGVYDKFNIKEVFPYRCDSGRIEYWICFVNKDRVSY